MLGDRYTLSLQEMNNLVMGLVVSKDLTSNFVLKPIKVNSYTGYGSD